MPDLCCETADFPEVPDIDFWIQNAYTSTYDRRKIMLIDKSKEKDRRIRE